LDFLFNIRTPRSVDPNSAPRSNGGAAAVRDPSIGRVLIRKFV